MKRAGKVSLPVLFYSNSMNYDREILFVLNEAGMKGLSIQKIARHVFNNCNGFFNTVSFEEIRLYVASYLNRNSKLPDSQIERTDVRGVYRINLSSGVSRQLQFDFKDDDVCDKGDGKKDEDRSLSLF